MDCWYKLIVRALIDDWLLLLIETTVPDSWLLTISTSINQLIIIILNKYYSPWNFSWTCSFISEIFQNFCSQLTLWYKTDVLVHVKCHSGSKMLICLSIDSICTSRTWIHPLQMTTFVTNLKQKHIRSQNIQPSLTYTRKSDQKC